jgi:hypothetical protein
MSDIVACWNPDIPEEKRKEIEADNARRRAYSNSWENVEKEGYGEQKTRVPNEKTDFANLELYKMCWDFEIKGVPYDVYMIRGYAHSSGNDKYVVPLGETPSANNIRPFDNNWNAVDWSFEIRELKSWKYKWDECRTQHKWIGILFRNGKGFHTVYGNDQHTVWVRLQSDLLLAQENVVNFFERGWEDKVRGMKIWYHEQPCVIDHVRTGDGETSFWVVGDNEEKKIPAPCNWTKEDDICSKQHWDDAYAKGCRVEWNSPHIKWFRK